MRRPENFVNFEGHDRSNISTEITRGALLDWIEDLYIERHKCELREAVVPCSVLYVIRLNMLQYKNIARVVANGQSRYLRWREIYELLLRFDPEHPFWQNIFDKFRDADNPYTTYGLWELEVTEWRNQELRKVVRYVWNLFKFVGPNTDMSQILMQSELLFACEPLPAVVSDPYDPMVPAIGSPRNIFKNQRRLRFRRFP